MNETLQYANAAKIQEMKSISKPRLPTEIYTFREIVSTDDYTKESRGTTGFGDVDSYGVRRFSRATQPITPMDSPYRR